MQIKNFIMSVSGGAVAVEVSEREVLRLAEAILTGRFYEGLPAPMRRELGDMEDYELSANNLGVCVIYDAPDGEGGWNQTEHRISDDDALIGLVRAIATLSAAAKEVR